MCRQPSTQPQAETAVVIPAGSCPWTSGITVSGKAIAVTGSGSGRIVAYTADTLTVGNGTKSVAIAGFSPGFDGTLFSAGTTLRISQNNNRANWMQGTVSSYSGTTLTMNITSTGGSGSTHRWLISTIPSTVLTNNSSTTLFTIAESTAGTINISGIKFAAGSGTGKNMTLAYTGGGQPILIHDCWMETSLSSGEMIDSTTNRGVIWHCSFDGSTANNGQLVTVAALRIKDAPPSSWTTPSTMGTADTDRYK